MSSNVICRNLKTVYHYDNCQLKPREYPVKNLFWYIANGFFKICFGVTYDTTHLLDSVNTITDNHATWYICADVGKYLHV
jgi:hypothetical protein